MILPVPSSSSLAMMLLIGQNKRRDGDVSDENLTVAFGAKVIQAHNEIECTKNTVERLK